MIDEEFDREDSQYGESRLSSLMSMEKDREKKQDKIKTFMTQIKEDEPY